MLTIQQLRQKKKWKYEKKKKAWLNRKKNCRAELKRKCMMRIMVWGNRLRVRKNLPHLDRIQVEKAMKVARDRRRFLKKLRKRLSRL